MKHSALTNPPVIQETYDGFAKGQWLLANLKGFCPLRALWALRVLGRYEAPAPKAWRGEARICAAYRNNPPFLQGMALAFKFAIQGEGVTRNHLLGVIGDIFPNRVHIDTHIYVRWTGGTWVYLEPTGYPDYIRAYRADATPQGTYPDLELFSPAPHLIWYGAIALLQPHRLSESVNLIKRSIL